MDKDLSVIPQEYILPRKEVLSQDLFNAADQGNLAEVQRLVIAGGDQYTELGPKGECPLIIASANGHHAVVEYLLNNGSRVNATDRFCQTSLHRAAENGHDDVIKLLISFKANLNVRDKLKGFTPLHSAAHNGHLQCVDALVQGGAHQDSKCLWMRKTPREVALELGHYEISEFLLSQKDLHRTC